MLIKKRVYVRVLNIPGFWIYWGHIGFWISLDSFWICLTMSEYVRLLNSSLTFLRQVWRSSQFAMFENSAKKNFHYFCKTLYHRCLKGLWISLSSSIYQGFKYLKVLNIPEFRKFQGSEYTRVLNMPAFWI